MLVDVFDLLLWFLNPVRTLYHKSDKTDISIFQYVDEYSMKKNPRNRRILQNSKTPYIGFLPDIFVIMASLEPFGYINKYMPIKHYYFLIY